MFTHILLPTDGSPLSEAAMHKGIQFAKSIHATVTGFHAIQPFHIFTWQTEMLEDTREQFEQGARAHAEHCLAVMQQAAAEAGVPCDTVCVTTEHPYEAIIQAAQDNGCDLILMASHGQRGMRGVLLGSETAKVLTHTQIPVLVFREAAP
jgi:nucleotide-binding universal stress UspA family protein